MKYKDYYQIMGVARSATQDEIKKAYRKLAHKYHPDISPEKDAKEHFQEVAEAYAALKDPEKRAAYDNLGSHQAGDEFRPPPDWGSHAGMGGAGAEGGIHFEDYPELQGYELPEWSHLAAGEKTRFTEALCGIIARTRRSQ